MRWKKGNHKLTVFSLILVLIGLILCVLPFTFWVTGGLLIGIGALLLVLRFIPNETFRNVLLLLLGCGLVLLESLMGLIMVHGQTDPEALNCKVAVVLGAQVNGNTPSMVLRTRLDAALAFMQENPDAIVFVSGGKGDGENVPEAEAMYQYLAAKGADMSRVYQETESSTTLENLRNTKALAQNLGISFDHVCIITSEFHAGRARFIASRLGIDAVSYTAQSRPWFFKMNYYLREIPAFLKAIVQTG